MKSGRFTAARTLVGFSVLALFLLQLARVKWAAGSLSGSAFFEWLRLLDLFAFAESAISSHGLTADVFFSAAPVLALYLVLGRAFCGWVCPLDVCFRIVNVISTRIRRVTPQKISPPPSPSPAGRLCRNSKSTVIPAQAGIQNEVKMNNFNPGFRPSPERRHSFSHCDTASRGEGVLMNFPPLRRGRVGMGVMLFKTYFFPATLLLLAALVQFPLFTLYISPITNFFRTIYAGFYWMAGFPEASAAFAVSGFFLLGFLLLEFVRPRLWCRHLCPIGKTYGLFNRISLLRVRIDPRTCTACRACEDACYQGVEILARPGRRKVRDASCILCGRCVEACQVRAKALSMGIGL